MQLCIQAILLACDWGKVAPDEEIISLSADTAILATASTSTLIFSPYEGMEIREIISGTDRHIGAVLRRVPCFPGGVNAVLSPETSHEPRCTASISAAHRLYTYALPAAVEGVGVDHRRPHIFVTQQLLGRSHRPGQCLLNDAGMDVVPALFTRLPVPPAVLLREDPLPAPI